MLVACGFGELPPPPLSSGGVGVGKGVWVGTGVIVGVGGAGMVAAGGTLANPSGLSLSTTLLEIQPRLPLSTMMLYQTSAPWERAMTTAVSPSSI